MMSMLYFFFNQQLYTLRKLNQGDVADPRAPLGGNFRPTQPLNGRTVRTNIFLTDKVKTNYFTNLFITLSQTYIM